MKISFIEPHLKVYGGIRRIIEISNRLVLRGHDVTIFHSDGSACSWMNGIARTKPVNDVLIEKHDVLIYNDPVRRDFLLAKKAKAKLKIFFVLELYKKELLKGFHISFFFPWNRRTRYLKKSLSQGYLICCNATWEQEYLEEQLGIENELLIGGINTKVFHPVSTKNNNGKKCILHSGDARSRKGTATIERAIQRVRSRIPNIIVRTYHGKGIPQNKMAEVYSSADVFIEGSRHAGWNNPVIEAMACKTPVVCTDIGGVKDFAINDKTAITVPVDDDKKMADAILKDITRTRICSRLVPKCL